MRRADRLFELVLLLRRGPVITALDLSRELEVSERTIYRDIQALILSGVPVEGEVGVGYVLRRGFELPPLMLHSKKQKHSHSVSAWYEHGAMKTCEKPLAVYSIKSAMSSHWKNI